MSQWKVLKSLEVFRAGFFRLRTDECQLPDGRVMPRYYVLEMVDWVNVLPVTDDGQAILLKQYRHAAGRDFLEIPGGTTTPGKSEDPRLAGERELLEETGYEAREWVSCGFHYPNPALQNNRMYTFLALGCRKVAEPSLDPYEDLETVKMDLKDALKIWEDGGFGHSLISASISLTIKHLKERGLIRGA